MNALKRFAAFFSEFDSLNPPYTIRMNDFACEKRLDRVRNAKIRSSGSVHAHGLKSRGFLGKMEACIHMRKLTIGLVVLIAAAVLTAGAVAAQGVAGGADDETSMDEQQEEREAMMGEMNDCPMADGGMMGMMHGDDMEESEAMMGEEMMDEMDERTREECQEMMGGGGMMGMMNGGMMDGMMGGGMDNMMNGDGSGMGCH
ncbi:hypothetical protein [Saliphagus infecundisoli]|uniref:Uncharacterized protein n=1 Tax=Saliphagus infecundisoli TaxID=1849069 RepID=A0ABD5QCN6_9EURY|nr:hypothetical protein [Saliphagus infecundisoli]